MLFQKYDCHRTRYSLVLVQLALPGKAGRPPGVLFWCTDIAGAGHKQPAGRKRHCHGTTMTHMGIRARASVCCARHTGTGIRIRIRIRICDIYVCGFAMSGSPARLGHSCCVWLATGAIGISMQGSRHGKVMCGFEHDLQAAMNPQMLRQTPHALFRWRCQ